MKIKRVLQGTALAALATAAWMGAGSADASAKVTIGNINIDNEDASGNIYISTDDYKEIMVGIVQVKGGKYQIKNWDVYEEGEADIDLSKLNVAKDNYIAIMSDDSDPFFLKIAKTDRPGKVDYKYNAEGIKLGSTEATELEYRTINSGWYNVAEKYTNKEGKEEIDYNLDANKYTYQGASLYLRVKSTLELPYDSKTGKYTESSETLDDKSTKNTEEKWKVYEIGSLASKEVKFNVRKQANGPSLSGDYAKNVIKGKADLSARIVDTDGVFYDFSEANGATAVSGSATTSKSLKTADLEKITAKLPKGAKVVLEVRTDVTDKKPASKWSRLELTVPNTIPAEKFSNGVTNGAIVTSGDAIKVEATYNWKDKRNGAKSYPDISIKNSASKGNVDVKVSDTGKVSTLKPGKSVKYKKADSDGKELYIRVGGDKDDKKWAGAWTKIGKITFPTDVAAATPTPAPTTK